MALAATPPPSYNATMRSRTFVAALLFFLGSVGIASAQALSLEFRDGRVTLTAENVPVSRILAEWARLGGTQIVNGERIPGAPVTLQLVDAPERQALEIVLRSAAGYMVLARDANSTGASAFAKIMVLPTTSRAPATAAPPQAPPPPPQFREPEPEVEQEEPAPGPPPNFPRGRVPNVNGPPRGDAQTPEDGDDASPEDEEPQPPPPGNPFGVVPGGARPGTINAPPPRSPGEAEQTPR
jgi:hypothetical protein